MPYETRSNSNAAVWNAYGVTPPNFPSGFNSALLVNAKNTMLDVKDGLSNTLMLGESADRSNGWSWGKQYADAATFGGIRGAWAQESNNITCSGTKGPVAPGTTPTGKPTTAADVTGTNPIGVNAV